MIEVTPAITLDESELRFSFVRGSGPGGQNVNKVETAAELRFDVAGSPSLPSDVRARLLRLAKKRINTDGVLVIEAKRFRTQRQNREDAIEQLVALIRRASIPPKVRRKTRPTEASRLQRLESKRRRSQMKSLRRDRPSSYDAG
jgi:ribosome-associated protein